MLGFFYIHQVSLSFKVVLRPQALLTQALLELIVYLISLNEKH